jgi:hypothetical protein
MPRLSEREQRLGALVENEHRRAFAAMRGACRELRGSEGLPVPGRRR